MKKSTYHVGLIILLLLPLIIFGIYLNTKDANDRQTTETQAQQVPTQTTPIAKNLEVPWALAFLPDGNLLFTERTGKVKLLNKTTNAVVTVATIPVKANAESGLLGLAVHPQFATNNFVYLYYSYAGTGGTQNRVVRYTFANNQLTAPTTIIDGIPGNDYHNGGRLKFGPDGFLYVTTGDGSNEATPQNINSLGGKILRVKDDGTAAPGNPFNNRVWSYGHRNPQGIAWDGTIMYATEHGPSQPSCCDEINRIEAGKNYGWPDVKGDELKDGTMKNLLHSGSDGGMTWAPSGAAFYNGRLFYAGLRGQALYEATVETDTATIVNQHYKNALGRIRDVIVGPDNMLYIATGNKSSQGGNAQPEDDKIIRVQFPNSASPAPTFVQPTGVTPTLFCLGGVPCTSPDPTVVATIPPGGGVVPTTDPNVTGTVNPTTNPTITPCETQSSIQHNKKKKKHKKSKRNNGGGWLSKFFEFLMKLLELLFRQFGITFPGSPNPGDPNNPNPVPVDPTPCPEPTTETPTEAPQPTEQPGTTETPSTTPEVSTTPATGTTPGAGTVPVGKTTSFVGDYDTGNFSQWSTCQWKGMNGGCSGYGGADYMAKIVNDGAGHETAARFEVRSGDKPEFGGERSEVTAPDASDVKEGDERWYEFSLKFPSDFQNPAAGWFIVMQWHAGDGSPPLALEVEPGGMLVLSNNRTNKSTNIAPIQKGQWVKYVLHAKFSSGSNAMVESWVNGVKQPGVHKEPNMATSSNYLKMGIYRGDQSATHVVLHDDLRITAP